MRTAEEVTVMMLESIRVMGPRCSRTRSQLRALIAHCQACRNHELDHGCTRWAGGDLWGHWRHKLVSGICENWPIAILG